MKRIQFSVQCAEQMHSYLFALGPASEFNVKLLCTNRTNSEGGGKLSNYTYTPFNLLLSLQVVIVCFNSDDLSCI